MSKRAYVSSVREAASAAKRAHMLEAAMRLLREEPNFGGLSMEAVAKAAGVTRLTIYNQFGSRRGLLETIFDMIAEAGQLSQLRSAAEAPDPETGLDNLVQIFCSFWSGDPAIGRLHDAMALDQELAQALRERNERRRPFVAQIVDRLAGDSIAPHAKRDATDMIFALTSLAMFRLLTESRSDDGVRTMIQAAVRGAIQRMVSTEPGAAKS